MMYVGQSISGGNALRSNRGIALIVTLLISGVMIGLLTAMLLRVGGLNFLTRSGHSQIGALYAAEAGLTEVQRRLEADPDYATDIVDRQTHFGRGQYSVTFGPGESVNNLSGTTDKPSSRGPLPPGRALVKVVGQYQTSTRTIEVILGENSFRTASAPLVVSGKVLLQGNVELVGYRASDNGTAVEADLISNSTQSGPQVEWIRNPGDTLRISGSVRSSSSDVGAVGFSAGDPGVTVGAVERDQAPSPVPFVDISAEVAARSSLPAPPALPTAPLSGDFYLSGDYVVNADVVLNDARLFVDGNLRVNGSIVGSGSVYATGDTELRGDSTINAGDDGVALYSKGNVTLEGFDGTAYIESLVARSSGFDPLVWTQTKESFRLMAQWLREGGPRLSGYPGDQAWSNDVNLLSDYLSQEINDNFAPHPVYGNSGVARDSTLFQLRTLLEGEPPNPSRDFLINKFRTLRGGSRSLEPRSTPLPGILGIPYAQNDALLTASINELNSTGELSDGIFTIVVNTKAARLKGVNELPSISGPDLDRAVEKIAVWLENNDYDRLGTSYFKGSIYTSGSFFAQNEVNILGTLAVIDDDDPTTGTSRVVQGRTLAPGDLFLGGGTKIVHVTDLEPGSPNGEARVGVETWLR